MNLGVSPKNTVFTLEAEDTSTAARAGLLRTAHAALKTPAFMPVGTQGSVKGLDNERLLSPSINPQMLLANAYYLYLRPGLDVIKAAGGLHAFMGWPRGLLTDSGGYQVFSLAPRSKISDQGVQFRAPIDGSTHTFTPAQVIDIQRALGADIIMPLDECTPYEAPRSYQQKAWARTQAWLETALQRFEETTPHYEHPQQLFPIIQGGLVKDLRKPAARSAAALRAAGYAIGGLSVGEPPEAMYQVLEWVSPLLPHYSPRYLMGVGTPENLLQAIARGVDMFDCVIPTRNGRNGMLFTTQGILNIRNAKWTNSQEVLDKGLNNPISQGYSRSYLRHLFISGERLAEYVASAHNLAFYADLLHQARKQIIAGNFKNWMKDTLHRIHRRG